MKKRAPASTRAEKLRRRIREIQLVLNNSVQCAVCRGPTRKVGYFWLPGGTPIYLWSWLEGRDGKKVHQLVKIGWVCDLCKSMANRVHVAGSVRVAGAARAVH